MKESCFSNDTLELLSLLEKHKVKYLVVGGEAVIFYGYARVTGDIDFFYDNSAVNASAVFRAMLDFWGGDIPGINSAEDFMESGAIIQFGQPPNRIDLINKVDGITFDEAWESRVVYNIERNNTVIQIYYIGIEPLIKNKKASGRYKDLDDLRFLSRLSRK